MSTYIQDCWHAMVRQYDISHGVNLIGFSKPRAISKDTLMKLEVGEPDVIFVIYGRYVAELGNVYKKAVSLA